MAQRKRKQWTAAQKAKIALEAIRERKTIQELARDYSVHPNQISKWKKQLADQAGELFGRGSSPGNHSLDEKERAELYEQIGRQNMEIQWLKKKAECFGD